MNIKKALAFFILLIFSASALPDILFGYGYISYNGYKRNENSHIITGGGLQWMHLNMTNGMSINTALSTYAEDGWVLATNQQMANLFNDFEFGLVSHGYLNENGDDLVTFKQNYYGDNEEVTYFSINANVDAVLGFLALFGEAPTLEVEGPFNQSRYSLMLYGSDKDGDGYYNHALVGHTFINNVNLRADAQMYRDDDGHYTASAASGEFAIMLVRKPNRHRVNPCLVYGCVRKISR